ncbi:response regulator [Zavarzinia compransoris]|uniref:response regulator n=1 Tax=Zavarzinia marina TaxID=2911065 RepID=UPI001F2C1C89|nr:response regulator [Zavarzinia marina]MCF4165109.1 response regulator [Zavarzinia marina]
MSRQETMRRILVVEDEAFIAFYLDAVLTDAGFEVIGPVDDALSAMRLAEAERPDLALMDIRLKGDLDGVTATRHLVESLGVPVVVVSANAGQAMAELRPLTRHVLGKPVASEELVATVRDALAA